MKVVVCGGGGFIGSHLVKQLLSEGHTVRACDIKPFKNWHQLFENAENLRLDLSEPMACRVAVARVDHVFNLAANMGGMGYIETHKAECMLNVLINTNLLIAARDLEVKKYFFSSSACIYPTDLQDNTFALPLREQLAYPAKCEDGYGWEKLFSERMCRHFREDYGLQTVIARYHNVYGTHGTWNGGREKAPAAICRKVIEAKLSGNHEIEIWGNGDQTRSFMWISDCIKGTQMLMEHGHPDPVNLGSSELVSINQLVDLVEGFAGVKLKRNYKLDAPMGVNGRNSDNTLIKSLLNWEPSMKLVDGMFRLFCWISDEIVKEHLRSAITK